MAGTVCYSLVPAKTTISSHSARSTGNSISMVMVKGTFINNSRTRPFHARVSMEPPLISLLRHRLAHQLYPRRRMRRPDMQLEPEIIDHQRGQRNIRYSQFLAFSSGDSVLSVSMVSSKIATCQDFECLCTEPKIFIHS